MGQASPLNLSVIDHLGGIVLVNSVKSFKPAHNGHIDVEDHDIEEVDVVFSDHLDGLIPILGQMHIKTRNELL